MPSLRPHLLALATLLLLPACGTKGSGVEASEVRQLEHFDEIEMGGVFHLVVRVEPGEQRVRITGDDNIVPKIETRVSGGKLIVEHDGLLRPELELLVEVWVPSLEGVEVSGAAEIDITGLSGERFELDLSGAGDAELSGRVELFSADISGAGKLAAKGLTAKTVELDMSGAGQAEVFAEQSLDIDVSGAGEVDYWGSPPEVRQDVSGAGSIRAR